MRIMVLETWLREGRREGETLRHLQVPQMPGQAGETRRTPLSRSLAHTFPKLALKVFKIVHNLGWWWSGCSRGSVAGVVVVVRVCIIIMYHLIIPTVITHKHKNKFIII